MRLKIGLFSCLIIVTCGCNNTLPTNSTAPIEPIKEEPKTKPTEDTKIKPVTKPELGTATELWNKLKSKDFSKPDQAKVAMAEIDNVLSEPSDKSAVIALELSKFKEGTITILHKLFDNGPINETSVKIFNKILSALPNTAKKPWLEQNDALSMLLIRKPGLKDNPQGLHMALNEVAQIKPDIKSAVEKIWETIHVIDFAIDDQNRIYALDILYRVADMPKDSTRIEINRALVKKTGMVKTNSGLWQSLIQGPIDQKIVTICTTLIDDQENVKDREELVMQRVGSLFNSALYYLIDLNIAKNGASDGPGVRLTTGVLPMETPYLNKLLALLILNGADTKKNVFPQSDTPIEFAKFNEILDRLLANGDMNAFVALFPKTISFDETDPFVSWVIAQNNRGPALKSILTSDRFDENAKITFRSQAFQLAINTDLETVVANNPPLQVGGILGFGARKLYVDKVALVNFNRILDNDFGLRPVLDSTDFQFGQVGTLIALLSYTVAANDKITLDRKKAVIETVSQKLKDIQGEKTWQKLVLTPWQTGNHETAVGALVKELKITESEAKKWLLI